MRRSALLISILLSACATTSTPSETPDKNMENTAPEQSTKPSLQGAMTQIAPLGQRLIDDQWTGGLVVALVSPEGVEVRGFGEASEGAGGAGFEIGSVSKVFTGMALASLVEAGVVKLDTPVADCLPPGTKLPAGPPITLKELTTHTSGLPRLPVNMDPSGADPYAAYTTAQLLDGLGQTTLGPKTYAYSNLGVGLLGVALARCAGEPSWEALIASRVTGPLGLKGTSVKRPLATGGHDLNMAPAGPWGFDALAGAGALRSDAADLALLLQRAMAGGDDAAARMLARSVTPLIDGPVKVGMGWHHGLGASAPLAGAVWHNGMTGGWSSFIAYMPGERRGVVVLSNAASPVIDLVAPEALRVLAGEQAALELPAVVKLDAAARERLVGRYQLAPQATLIVTTRGEELWAELTGQPAFRVWPESATRVNYRVVEATLEFTLPEAGPASALTLHQGGQHLPAPRVGEP